MIIEQRTVDDVVVLSIIGDIATSGGGAKTVADKVRSVLRDGHNRVLLDLGHVRYVDSSGLGALLQAFSAARSRGGALKLLNVNERLNDLLVLTRLLTVLECFDQEGEALASFNAQPVAH